MKGRSLNIHERFLRHVWSRQYLQGSGLQTTDGRAIRVLETGTMNLDGGPDFKNASVRIGGIIYSGDIEIHRNAIEWLRHQHQEDPRYNQVILHVVLESDHHQSPMFVNSGRTIPTLVLEPFLSESIRSLWQKTILDERTRTSNTIRCSHRNENVPADLIHQWLRRLSVERLELKLRRFEERVKELAHLRVLAAREPRRFYGPMRTQGNLDDIPPPHKELTQKDLSKRVLWEQVLYEGLMEALGYSKNQEPFARLAKSVSLETVRDVICSKPASGQELPTGDERLQSLLFGAAGLLPKIRSLRETESKRHAKTLAREWKEIRKTFRGPVLHLADWQFFPTRPTNFPTLRLAAATLLVQKFLNDDLFRRIVQTIKSEAGPAALLHRLRELLSVQTSGFWAHHYHFDERTSKPIRALGVERTNDMIINAIIPVSLLYARTFRDRDVRESALKLYEFFPPLMENSVTRLMERQLLRGKVKLGSVGLQQGAIQLYKFYCREERCEECEVGKTVFAGRR